MKRTFFVLVLIYLMAMLAGCSDSTSSEKPTPTSFLDFLHAEIPPGTFTSHELDNSTLSEEEYRLRRVINSLSMYHEVTGQEYEMELNDVEKYGIYTFSKLDDWYPFHSIEDMATVFNNEEFQQDFYAQYGYNLEINAYYLPMSSLIEMYNASIEPINLIVWDDDYNLSIDVSGYKDHSFILCDIFYTQNKVDLQALMEFYESIDRQGLNSALADSDTLVYYMSTETGSVFFEDIGMQTTELITAYIWQQDDVIGVLILPGGFNEENLDLCILEKHEI